ncbi:hypothetical protein [Actinomadura sp. WMMB 499]|uniref:hypothetical protein n=1 Tax=Actinomadura sp. WMMB 499 TaxID=1219491 RepID=UPI0012445F7B|nr:hypothetical protein [Actinomadura sp. WMMB 499]QFG22249.1 hypothetical protein F7P10_15060 [Actinomadura sp. WMMB 499]
MPDYPQPASIAVVDIVGSSGEHDMAKRRSRAALYAWLEGALGRLWTDGRHADRGDGVLMVWGRDVPKVEVLTALLRLPDHLPDGVPPRIRVAVHAGDVYADPRGLVGDSVNRTFRLNEAGLLREAIARARGPVAYLVSDEVHGSVVEYGYDGLDPDAFHEAVVDLKESTRRAWLHIPREDGLAARLAARSSVPRPAAPAQAGGVHITTGGNAEIRDSTIAGGDIHGTG